MIEGDSWFGEGSSNAGDVRRSAVGAGAEIAEGATIRDSVILEGATIGSGCSIDGCLIGLGANIPDGEKLFGEIVSHVLGTD
jgi:ADP-glucose pyrophosphorylase